MSEQITVTDPSVSTAGRRRITAWRAAMRCTPMASVIDMMAGSPSGIAATISPTAVMNISATGRPRTSVPKANRAVATTTTASVTQRASWPMLRISGVVTCSTDSSRRPMRPISVALAVATTSPRAWPWVTRVPA